MAHFDSLLDTKAEDVKRPPAAPQGTYLCTVSKFEGFMESKEKKTPFVRYMVTPVQALEDVDAARLTDVDLTKKKLRLDFYLTEDALWRLTEFFPKCGLDVSGHTTRELIPLVVGSMVKCYITEIPNRNDPNDPPYNEIQQVMSAA